jgi:hypothetical protein
MKKPLTIEQRRTEFKTLFDSISVARPAGYGSIIDRIAVVCSILHCSEHTVRVWLIQETDNPRAIPEAKLRILRTGLARLCVDK